MHFTLGDEKKLLGPGGRLLSFKDAYMDIKLVKFALQC